ncbi:MAG: hypothetical protein DSZ01_07590 [Gammaproteobacteria bacterium]|nr:MAG: hypothetical protein DSZ01_07590 [Gammaproteobacteria bacterium]
MIGRKKKNKNKNGEAAPEPSVAMASKGVTRSRSIFSYYLPVILVAVVSIALFTFASSWLAGQAASERQDRLTHSLAVAVQQRVAELVQGRMALVSVLARDPQLEAALKRGEKPGNVAKQLQERMPEATLVVVVPARWNDEKVLRALSGSYAAADMFQEVLRSRGEVPAEAIKDREGKRHLLVAAPVLSGNKVEAVLFAGFPLGVLKKSFSGLQLNDAYVSLEQVFAGGSLLLASAGDDSLKGAVGKIKVPGTIWEVHYAAPAVAGMAWPLLLSLVLGGALLLLAVTLFGYRRLARDCKADMGLMVALVDATLKRKGSATPVPHLAEAKPAMELLARYAQATFTAEKAGHSENRAGVAQVIVEEVEPEEI